MAESIEKPIGVTAKPTRPQQFYDNIKRKFAEERDLRLGYRPEGTAQSMSDLTGALSKYPQTSILYMRTPSLPAPGCDDWLPEQLGFEPAVSRES